MRKILALPLLLVAACDAQKDEANDRTTYELNEQKIERSAEEVGKTAENVVSDIGDAAKSAGQKIEEQVDDVNVDVDVNRNRN